MSYKAIIRKIKPPSVRNNFSSTYARVPDENEPNSSHSGEKGPYSTPPKRLNLLTIGNMSLFIISIGILSLAYGRPVSDAACTRQLFSYSPALEAVEYHEEDFKGLFHQPSIYRGTPTDEIDENWRVLWDCKYSLLPIILDILYP